jgi:hypothetical protein
MEVGPGRGRGSRGVVQAWAPGSRHRARGAMPPACRARARPTAARRRREPRGSRTERALGSRVASVLGQEAAARESEEALRSEAERHRAGKQAEPSQTRCPKGGARPTLSLALPGRAATRAATGLEPPLRLITQTSTLEDRPVVPKDASLESGLGGRRSSARPRVRDVHLFSLCLPCTQHPPTAAEPRYDGGFRIEARAFRAQSSAP